MKSKFLFALALVAVAIATIVAPQVVDAGAAKYAKLKAKYEGVNVAPVSSMQTYSANCDGSVSSSYSYSYVQPVQTRVVAPVSTRYSFAPVYSVAPMTEMSTSCSGSQMNSAPPPTSEAPAVTTVAVPVATPSYTLINDPPKRVSYKIKN